jgi:spore coat protein U-like protein
MKKTLIPIALVFAMIAVAPAAFAAAQSGSLTVTAGVAAKCTIAASATLAFGAYDPVVTNGAAGVDLDNNATMAVTCTKGFDPIITIPLAGRVMNTSPAIDPLNYLLFSNATRTTTFGENLGTGFHMGAAPSKAPRDVTIYGRVVKNQDVNIGAYSGTISVTVNF